MKKRKQKNELIKVDGYETDDTPTICQLSLPFLQLIQLLKTPPKNTNELYYTATKTQKMKEKDDDEEGVESTRMDG